MREKLLKQRKLGIAGMIVGVLVFALSFFVKKDADHKLMMLDQAPLDQTAME